MNSIRACFDCGEGPCHMNCGPWCPPGERFIGRTDHHTVTQDANDCYRVFATSINICMGVYPTPVKAFEAAEAFDMMAEKNRAADPAAEIASAIRGQ